jgi:hypothetical protein
MADAGAIRSATQSEDRRLKKGTSDPHTNFEATRHATSAQVSREDRDSWRPLGLGGFIHTLTAKTTKREDCQLHAANYFRSSPSCAGSHPWRMKRWWQSRRPNCLPLRTRKPRRARNVFCSVCFRAFRDKLLQFYFRNSPSCAGAHPWRVKMVEILRGL